MIEVVANFPAIDAWILKRIDKMHSFMGDHHTLCAFDADGTVLAAVAFDSFTPYECCIHLVVDDPRGVTPLTLRKVFSYPFLECGFQRLSATVPRLNYASRAFLRRVGFKHEGVKRNAIDGEDELLFGMLKTECRWIR